ncbi:MAG TPA: hypothetical protein ENK91_13775 [Bacteroidetes bacterium]|nr:hypothetical protein [Bacteroidota bacterium]
MGVVPYYFIRKNRFKIDLGIYFSALLKNRIETNFTGTYIIYKKTDIGLEISPSYRLLAIYGKNIYINALINYSLFPIYTEGKGYYIATNKGTKNFSLLFGVSIQIID